MSALEVAISKFILKIQRGEIHSSYKLAKETLNVLSVCVSCSNSSRDVEQDIIRTSERLIKATQFNVVINNCCARVIKAINEEMNKTFFSFSDQNDVRRSRSMSLLELFAQPLSTQKSNSFDEDPSFKMFLRRIIQDFVEDIPQFCKEVTKRSPDFVHSGDVIFTVGRSKSVLAFLSVAKKANRKFKVMVAEHAPINDGIKMANDLKKEGIDVIVIPDSAIYAVMPKISTIIISCKGVLADGNIICTNYVLPIVMAAKHHAVPVVALYWKWKLAERFLKPGDSFTQLSAPSDVIQYLEEGSQKITIFNPEGEVVPGNYITIFVNEDGPHGRADIFSLMQSIYHSNE